MMRRALIAGLLVGLCLAAPAWAVGPQFTGTCNTISWTANQEPDLAGYKIYDRTDPNVGPTYLLSVGIQITSVPCSQFNFNPGQHYVSISAFDTSGNESVLSPDFPFVIVSNIINDLRITAVTATGFTLTFTEVDDGTGMPANYDMRLATPVIQWGSASSVGSGTCSTPIGGSSIGASRSCTVTGLALTTGYQFQTVPYRGTLGQQGVVFGPLSNIASGTTGGSVPSSTRVSLYTDTFSGADGALPAPWRTGYGGFGIPQIVAHTVQSAVLATESYASYGATMPPDQYGKIIFGNFTGAAPAEIGIMLSATPPPVVSFVLLYARLNSGTFTSSIGTYIAGSWTTAISENATSWGATDGLIAERIGDTFNLYRVVAGVETLLLTTALQGFQSGLAGVYTLVGSGGSLADVAIAAVEIGTFATASSDPCGCDQH